MIQQGIDIRVYRHLLRGAGAVVVGGNILEPHLDSPNDEVTTTTTTTEQGGNDVHLFHTSGTTPISVSTTTRSLQLIKDEERREELLYDLETIPETAPTDWSNEQLIAVIIGAAIIVIVLLILYFCCKSVCWYLNRGNNRRSRNRGGNDDDDYSSSSSSASSESSATIKEREEVAQLGANIIGNVMAMNKQMMQNNPKQQPTYNYNIERPADNPETHTIVDENGYIHQQHAHAPQPPNDDDGSQYSGDSTDSQDTLDHVRIQHEH